MYKSRRISQIREFKDLLYEEGSLVNFKFTSKDAIFINKISALLYLLISIACIGCIMYKYVIVTVQK